MSLALAANAGGIDKAKAAAIAFNDFVDRIARGAGNRRDDGAIRSSQAIQQRGLAYIGMADDCDLGFIDGSGFGS